MAGRVKVLIAESNDSDAEWLVATLQKIPMDCVRVKLFKEISRQLKNSQFDVILMNLFLPDKSGIKAVTALKELVPEIPIVVSVPEGEEKIAYEAVRNGAQGFIRNQTLESYSAAAVIYQAFKRQNTILEIHESQRQLSTLVQNLPGFAYRCYNDLEWTMKYISGGCKDLTGYAPDDFIDNKKVSYRKVIHPDDREKVRNMIENAVKKKERFQIDYRIITADGIEKWVWEQGNAVRFEEKNSILEGFITDISEKKLREMQMQSIISIGEILRNTTNQKDYLNTIIQRIGEIYQVNKVAIMLTSDRTSIVKLEAALGPWETFIGKEEEIRNCVSYTAIQENRIVTYDIDQDEAEICQAFKELSSRYIGFVPLATKRKISGLVVVSKQHPFYPHELEAFKAIADIVASALERSNLIIKTENQLRRMESLHTIDQAITSVFEIKVVSKIILDQVRKELDADAADILILNPALNTLEYIGADGFLDRFIQNSKVPLTTSVAGKILLENKGYAISNLKENPLWFIRENMQMENFNAYFAKPIISKGVVVGVMEIFFKKPYYPDEEWNTFFESLTAQTAVAYDSYRKYTDLQKVQQNMASSFRSTLETWSRSLELNEGESHGHIRRVTNGTIRLAREMGVAEEELPNIERGALLHDIGKIGIVDHILLKKGELTDEEWTEIRRHPQIARDLLHNVKLLDEAMDIPYSHHENWDGSGYPQGLRGEEIPLAARVFSVVETYDALLSERPFRKPWTKDDTIQYLIQQKGKKFDPDVVDKFLGLIHYEIE